MPSVPTNNKCASLGCKNPRSRLNTYCLEHGGLDNMARRETDSAYQTPMWKTTRMAQLSKQPLCQGCLARGVISAASHVDHLFAWKHLGGQAFSRNIWQSLCPNCHSQKTALEKQGVYRHYAQDGVKDYSKHDYFYVVRQHENCTQ